LPRLLARTARQGGGVEQEDGIDVGRIIKFAAAVLAERDNGEAAGLLVRGALEDGGRQRALQSAVSKVGELLHQRFKRHEAGEIADPQDGGEGAAFPTQRSGEIRGVHTGAPGLRQSHRQSAALKGGSNRGEPLKLQL
jgi:hypothetical protein